MLDEEQISFRSASHMFDGVEDYSHQIAEMIGLRNESSFRQAGVSVYMLFIEIGKLSVCWFHFFEMCLIIHHIYTSLIWYFLDEACTLV